ncbi:hypothetical protein RvY_01535 [Ramazzottius varieornatus]|uniref:SET domain-containing protein n=1 Tax=Ramazzottius varieornatus TaxID=947166 RepID=A0A1D1UMQ0_RAMVA|nr:hypothetical protein RvY_01535 [Ramazzottius varieornatus]
MEEYQRIFSIDYEAVRTEVDEQKQTFFIFPLLQSRPVTADTPAPPRRRSKASDEDNGKALSTTHTEISHLRGVRVTRDHARLIIPIVIRTNQETNLFEYVILPDFVVSSFDDIETWLIAFSKKFILKEKNSQEAMHLKIASDLSGAVPQMTYDIGGLRVQAWTTIDEANLYYQIFAPPTFPLSPLLEHATDESLISRQFLFQLTAKFDKPPEVNGNPEGKRPVIHAVTPQKSAEDAADLALITATTSKNYQVMKILLDNGADVMAQDGHLQTSFHIAAAEGDLEALRILVLYNKKPQDLVINAPDAVGRTALMDAAEAKSVECVKFLLEHGANAAARDHHNETALHKVVLGGWDQAIGVLLRDHGCSLTATNNVGMTASTLAATKLLPYHIPESSKKLVMIPVMECLLDFPFSTAKHRLSQGQIFMDISNVGRRPLFEFQYGLTIQSRTEAYIQLRPNSAWSNHSCACHETACKTCVCVRIANRGQQVFTSRGLLLSSFPETQPIVLCSPFCRCSKDCPLRSLCNVICPNMEIYHDNLKKIWCVRTREELKRGQFVSLLAGEIIHPRFMDEAKPYRYLIFSRSLSIDISHRANCSRFFGDSTQPNLRIAVVKSFDKTKPPQIAFFASEWIAEGETLCYDKSHCFDVVQQVLRDQCFSEFRFDF